MKLIELRCKNCKAKLVVDEETKEATCNYCGTVFKIDDEVKHIKYDDMEQSGYEFEKGRIRAQEEHRARRINRVEVEHVKRKRSIWFYILCFMFFPFVLTYLVVKSKKLNTPTKAVIIIVMWIFFIYIAYTSNEEEKLNKKNKIIECYSVEVYNKLDEVIGVNNIDGSFLENTVCKDLNLKDDNKPIDIIIDDNEVIGIKVGEEYLYRRDNSVN